MRLLLLIVFVTAVSGCRHPANTSQRLPSPPSDFLAYRTPTNLADQIMGADHIVVTNVDTFSITISGGRAKEIVQAVSLGRRYKYGVDPAVLWDCELQFYNPTSRLASVSFEGGAFSGDGAEIYVDEMGVLDKLYREIINQSR